MEVAFGKRRPPRSMKGHLAMATNSRSRGGSPSGRVSPTPQPLELLTADNLPIELQSHPDAPLIRWILRQEPEAAAPDKPRHRTFYTPTTVAKRAAAFEEYARVSAELEPSPGAEDQRECGCTRRDCGCTGSGCCSVDGDCVDDGCCCGRCCCCNHFRHSDLSLDIQGRLHRVRWQVLSPNALTGEQHERARAFPGNRRHFAEAMTAALETAAPWKAILINLHSCATSPCWGVGVAGRSPALARLVERAQVDAVLQRYPALHADLVFYRWDEVWREPRWIVPPNYEVYVMLAQCYRGIRVPRVGNGH